jgi:hypothetical protein
LFVCVYSMDHSLKQYGIFSYYSSFNVVDFSIFREQISIFGMKVKVMGGIKFYSYRSNRLILNGSALVVYTEDLKRFVSLSNKLNNELLNFNVVPFGYFLFGALYVLDNNSFKYLEKYREYFLNFMFVRCIMVCKILFFVKLYKKINVYIEKL